MESLTKQSYEKLAYDFEFADVMSTGEEIDSVVSVVWTACGVVTGASALTASTPTSSEQTAQSVVEGGTHGESYKGTAKVIGTTGQKYELEGLLEVIDK
jgi:hypothetical protein